MFTVSIVLFHSDYDAIESLIREILQSRLCERVYLIDNSSENSLAKLSKLSERVSYHFSGYNLGYGRGHNIAINFLPLNESRYHAIVNPDVILRYGDIESLIAVLEKNSSIGCIAPKLMYPSGEWQNSRCAVPLPWDLFVRRFLPNFITYNKYNYNIMKYEEDVPLYCPIVSGAFMLFKSKTLVKIGGFDTKFFMYLEDFDISRRVAFISKVLYYPHVKIFHVHGKGSYKQIKLLVYHIASAIKYFNKWGWFSDEVRVTLNSKISEFNQVF